MCNLTPTHFVYVRMRYLFKSYNACRYISRMMSSQRNIVAVCQMNSRNDKDANLSTCKSLVQLACEQGANMVFLPEACDYVGESRAETLRLAEPLDGPLVQEYRNLAKNYNVWLSLGGIHQKATEETIRNSHVIINNVGDIVAVYNKAHLFDVEIPDKNIRLKESDYVERGENIIPPISSPVGNIGMGICYDMRFPELSICLRNMGAEILTFPSAFTKSTGESHWEILLRARAIETQCYVIAAAQTGIHNPKRSSWGHAMVVDPWGTIVAECAEGVNIATTFIDLAKVEKTRANMPVWQHRRLDLYPLISAKKRTYGEMFKDSYQFGESVVKADQIFYESEHSFAFTNKKCVVPGHVLVAPKRGSKRLCELNSEEVSNLFVTVTFIQKFVEYAYKCNSSTVCVQDGEDAGQTVKHVHVHIIPRKAGDFKRNDDVYGALENLDKGKERTESEMFEEAEVLRRRIFS